MKYSQLVKRIRRYWRDIWNAPRKPLDRDAILDSLKTIWRNFIMALGVGALLSVLLYFAAFHGECSIRIIAGPGETVYHKLYTHEQFFFNMSISRKIWWEVAENSARFDVTGYNGGRRIRWRGFGTLWKWEEPFDVVY